VVGFINTNGTSGGYKIDNNLLLQASSTNFSTLVGYRAGASLLWSAIQNTAVGFESLAGTTGGTYNTAIGYRSLYANTIGSYNTASGHNSLLSNTTGSYNTANGTQSLVLNTTGSNNTVVGRASLYYNTSATSSVALGNFAGAGTANYNNQGGTYIGYQSGYSASTGSDYNTLLGYQSGFSLTTGAYNIAIGQNVDLPSNTGSQQLNIGNVLYGTGMYNGSAVSGVETAGNIGIGTTSPWARFSVAGASLGTTPLFTISSSTASATSTAFIIDSNGKVGVGTSTPGTDFAVQGGALISGITNLMGHCVTGDTKLRRRRRKKGKVGGKRSDLGSKERSDLEESDFIYDEVAIKDIQPGDEIATLDETTGKIVYRKVKVMMEMGTRPIFKLTTSSGKTIRTTAEHPYFVLSKNIAFDKIKPASEVWHQALAHSNTGVGGQLNRNTSINSLKRITCANDGNVFNSDKNTSMVNSHSRVFAFIDASNVYHATLREGWEVDYEKLYTYLTSRYGVSRVFFFCGTTHNKKRANLYDTLLRVGYELVLVLTRLIARREAKADVDSAMTFEMMRRIGEYDAAIVMTGDGDYYDVLKHLLEKKQSVRLVSTTESSAGDLRSLFGSKFIHLNSVRHLVEYVGASDKNNEAETTNVSASGIVPVAYTHRGYLSSAPPVDSKNGMWRKVIDIKEGQEIAIEGQRDTTRWDKIVKIEKLPAEQVYDIEVEGTHNFIGNGIVAHNTYLGDATLSGNLSVAGNTTYTGTGTTTFAGDILSRFASFWNGLEVSKITSTSTATSTFAGGVATAGLSSTNGLTISGGVILPASSVINSYLANSTIGLTSSGSVTVGTSPISLGGSSALDLNMANANVWTALQTFGNASTTQIGSTGSAYFATASGNVGIGTTSPASKLQVTATVSGATSALRISDTVGNRGNWNFGLNANEFLYLYPTTNTGGGVGTQGFIITSADQTTSRFQVDNISGQTLLAPNGGNVGIGTTDPQAKLDVAVGNIQIDNAFYYQVQNVAGAARNVLGADASENVTVGSSALTGDLKLNTAGVASAVVVQATTGNIGIGTNGPGDKLEIVGGSIIIGNNSGYKARRAAGGLSTIFRITPDDTLQTYLPATGENYEIWNGAGTSVLFKLLDSGNVGIGTTSPLYKLSVEYTSDGDMFQLLDTDGNCTWNPESGGVTPTCSSDARLKTDIVAAMPELPYLLGLPIKDYKVIASGDKKTGVVAQELLAAGYDDLVSMGSDGYYGVSEVSSWKVIKGVQELNTRINEIASSTAELARAFASTSIDQIIASSTANVIADQSFISRVTEAILAKFADWGVAISQTLTRIANLVVGTVRVENQLCVDDVCVSKDQLKAMLVQAGGGITPPDGTPPYQGVDEGVVGVPTILIQGNNPAEISVGATYVDLGVIARDSNGLDLSVHYFVNGAQVSTISLDTSTSTSYTIDYSATDNNNLTATSTRVVNVGSGTDTAGATTTSGTGTTTPPIIPPIEPPPTIEIPVETATTTPDVASTTPPIIE
jgi:uncharacterized LabA/DUF88 family protein